MLNGLLCVELALCYAGTGRRSIFGFSSSRADSEESRESYDGLEHVFIF